MSGGAELRPLGRSAPRREPHDAPHRGRAAGPGSPHEEPGSPREEREQAHRWWARGTKPPGNPRARGVRWRRLTAP
jgi:hypothetical protein